MSILEFLTSKEIIVVYIVTAVACLLCFIIYLVEKNNGKALRKHNTRELNKLVEEVQDEVEIEDSVKEENPEIIQTVEINPIEIKEEQEEKIEEIEPIVEEEVQEIISKDEEVQEVNLEYEEVVPSVEEAREELHKLTMELEKQEDNNIELTNYEVEQEETAIISLEELIKKGKEMYDANELRETTDDVNAPISLHELEERVGKTATNITDTFIIENVVPEEELIEEPVIVETRNIIQEEINPVKVELKETGFIPSPIISPIYGIEKEISPSELELENTADYEKLDAEIKKTNEFLMTLRELQNKLD